MQEYCPIMSSRPESPISCPCSTIVESSCVTFNATSELRYMDDENHHMILLDIGIHSRKATEGPCKAIYRREHTHRISFLRFLSPFCRMSFSDIYYDQHLQSLPQVLQESAVEFDKVSLMLNSDRRQ